MNTQRKTGHYWVKRNSNWQIARYINTGIEKYNRWEFDNEDYWYDNDFEEIDERQILRESEVNGKNLQLQEHNEALKRLNKSIENKLINEISKNTEVASKDRSHSQL